METQAILNNASLTKTEKIRQLLALGLTRNEVAALTGGNYGFVQNVFARYWPEQVRSRQQRHQVIAAATARRTVGLPLSPESAAFNRRFGVEIEAGNITQTRLANALRAAGISVEVENYNHTTRRYWKVVTDSSLRGTNSFELVSPILEGQAGLNELETVCRVLKAERALINRSCGLHVHFDAEHIGLAQTKNLLINYARYETLIDSFMPASRRGRTNTYCGSMIGLEQRIAAAASMNALTQQLPNRYMKVNLQSYVRHRTIEFRQHSGTVEFEKISNWVLFLHNLVNYSLTNRVESATMQSLNGFQQPEVMAFYHNRQSELAA